MGMRTSKKAQHDRAKQIVAKRISERAIRAKGKMAGLAAETLGSQHYDDPEDVPDPYPTCDELDTTVPVLDEVLSDVAQTMTEPEEKETL